MKLRALALALLFFTLRLHAQWIPPTPEELKMASQPEVPGAAAVYLDRNEATEDDMHDFTIYARIKVLTERGKEYGTIELPYESGGHAHLEVTDIAGRTIHPDGTIIPFTGKPFKKLIEKTKDSKFEAKVFSLPDIEVGSILEYRYKLRFEDNYVIPPEWLIQSNLYTRKAHYQWKPTIRAVYSGDHGAINTVQWFPILPKGAEVKYHEAPGMGGHPPQQTFSLDIASIPPTPEDDFLPPITFASYRVMFYYSLYRSVDEFWDKEGKQWSKDRDKFIGPGPAVRAAALELAPASAPPLDRLKSLYSAVMKLENTDFTRAHTASEEKANGVKEVKTTDDIFNRKRGTGDQMAELFVALARAAGFKAYLLSVCNRDNRIFLKGFLSFSQFEDDLAVVDLDGKSLFFDPGQRYIPFQHLAWKHTVSSGIRQTDRGSAFVDTPGESYTASRNSRVADLVLDKEGQASGPVRFTFNGPSALYWRQQALLGDTTSLNRELEESCERLLGSGIEVKVNEISKLTSYEEPLVVNFTVKGPIASGAGHRLLIASDLFEGLQNPTFPSKERKNGVYFHYASMTQDVVRIRLPSNLTVESVPKPTSVVYKKLAAYGFKSEQTPNSYIIRRDLTVGEILFSPEEYPELRNFYTTFEAQDREPVVLKAVAPSSGTN